MSESSATPSPDHRPSGAAGATPQRVVRRRSSKGLLTSTAVLVVAVLAVTIAYIVGLQSYIDKKLAATAPPPPAPTDTDVHSAESLAALAADLETETGSTQVLSLVLYPTYAIVTVPPGPEGGRAVRYRWTDDLRQRREVAAADPTRFDLADLEWAVLERLDERAAKAFGTKTQYFAVHPPDAEGAEIHAYAALDGGRTGFVAADLDGSVIRVYRPS